MNHNFNSNFNSIGNNQQDTNNYQPYNTYRQNQPNNNSYGQTPPNINHLYTPNKSRGNAKLIILAIIIIVGGLLLSSRTNWFKQKVLPGLENILNTPAEVPAELVGVWYSNSVKEYSDKNGKQTVTNDIVITIEKDGTYTQSGNWAVKLQSGTTIRRNIDLTGKCYVNKNKTKFKVDYENAEDKTGGEKLYDGWNDYTLVGNEFKMGKDVYKRVQSNN